MFPSLDEYLNTYKQFELFGLSHWVAIFLFLLLVVLLSWYAKTYLNANQQNRVGITIGLIVFLNYPIWIILEIFAGSFDVTLHLPLHLCRFANLLIPFVMIKRNYFVFEILYFWGLSGMLQGMITPDIVEDFPHFHYFRYFAGHHLLVVAVIYAVVVYNLKPTLNSLIKAFIALNAFLVIALFANLVLDANYFWIMGKPPAGSLLDYMGPWPWYILTGEFVALGHFILAYLLYLLIDKINARS